MLASLKAIAEVLNEGQLAASLSVVLRRVQKGVKEELLSLARLREMGRYRARMLFVRGIRTRENLSFDPSDFLRILSLTSSKLQPAVEPL
ncbi:MAG TPA: hypothetical protein VJN71_08950 [Nitrososphaerales archaeon]|nr:hypothetical protein [Nitrososphaerales archaeon]